MAIRSDIRTMIRQQLGLWPDTDPLAVSIPDATTPSVTVTDAAKSPAGALVEIESEVMYVRAANEATDVLTVRRGDRGTAPVSHAIPQTVFIYGPHDLTNIDLNRLIGDGIRWLYPVAVRDIWDESLTTAVGTIAYTIPTVISLLEEVRMEDGNTPVDYRLLRWWKVATIGTDRKLFVPNELPPGRKLQLHGRGKFTVPSSDATTLDVPDELLPAVYYYCLANVVKHRDLIRSQFTGQSALLESRAAGLSELIGSYRDLIRQAEALRAQHATPRPWSLRRLKRHG